MTFDPTINVTNLVAIGLAAIAFIGGWYKFGGRLDMLEFRVASIEKTLEIIAKAIEKQTSNETHLALVDQRVTSTEGMISNISTEISDLRRGKGFIRSGVPHSGVDGEY